MMSMMSMWMAMMSMKMAMMMLLVVEGSAAGLYLFLRDAREIRGRPISFPPVAANNQQQ